MITNLNLNTIKMYEWDTPSMETGCLMSGLILMSMQNDLVLEKDENLFYNISNDKLMEELPILKSLNNIIKHLKILESKSLIKLYLEEHSINYMFTEKGASWLIYDLTYGKKYMEAFNA